jgi:hypothetical protein
MEYDILQNMEKQPKAKKKRRRITDENQFAKATRLIGTFGELGLAVRRGSAKGIERGDGLAVTRQEVLYAEDGFRV